VAHDIDVPVGIVLVTLTLYTVLSPYVTVFVVGLNVMVCAFLFTVIVNVLLDGALYPDDAVPDNVTVTVPAPCIVAVTELPVVADRLTTPVLDNDHDKLDTPVLEGVIVNAASPYVFVILACDIDEFNEATVIVMFVVIDELLHNRLSP
jgi:hypothetical protein